MIEELKHLREENAELKQQLEAEKNKHIKIQYKYHEYTISQLCSRMDKLERLLKAAVEDICTAMEFNSNSSCRVCAHYYRCKCDGICMIKDGLRKWRYADEANEFTRKQKVGYVKCMRGMMPK